MAVTTISSNPTFTKGFSSVISIGNMANYQLLSDRESIPIPTEFDGTLPVFTEAIATFNVKQANKDRTSSWIISKYSESNCTVTVNDITKTATVTAISADMGSFIIKATKAGENTIYKSVVVFKSKYGQDGDGTPDDITIQENGYNNLEVIHTDVYDDASLFTDCLNIGFGSIQNPNSYLSTNVIRIGADPSNSSIIERGNNVVVIGDNQLRSSLGSSTFTNGTVTGNDLYLYSTYESPYITDNFFVCGIGGDRFSQIRSNSVAFGISPTNKIDNSISISLPGINQFPGETTHRNREFYYKNTMAKLDISTAGSMSFSLVNVPYFLKAKISIYGYYRDTSYVNYFMVQEQHMTILEGTTAVNYSNADELYKTGIFLSSIAGSLTCAFSTDTFTITLPALATDDYVYWYANFEIQAVGGDD